jgi:hypothetical protein
VPQGSGTARFTKAALRACLRRRIGEAARDGAAGPGWSEADRQLARHLYAALAVAPDLQLDLPASPHGVDDLPELDWSALTLDQLAVRVRAAGEHGPAAGAPGADGAGQPAGSTLRERGAGTADALSFATFMEERTRRRDAQAEGLRARRQEFGEEAARLRERHFRAAAELFEDDAMPRAARAEVVRHHRRALQRDLAELERARAEVLGAGRPWYSALIDRWRNERGDRADYAHAIAALYDDRLAADRGGDDPASARPDPVLVTVPGARRHRDRGTIVYTRRTDAGVREMFRLLPEEREVVVRSADAVATEAAVVAAYRLNGPPLAFAGSAAFRERCERIAARHGFETGVAADPVEQHQAEPAPTGAGRPGAASPASTAGSASPTVVPDLEKYADIVAYVKEQTDVDFVLALEPKHAVAMEPIYLSHTGMSEGPFDLVFVQNPGAETIVAIVLPRGIVPPNAALGETRLSLEVENGDWKATFHPAELATPVAAVRDLSPARGR